MEMIRWGILGCGGIANKFAAGAKKVERAEILACASRTEGKAAAFAEKHSIERVYTDYDSLGKDGDIDAVYIATTHNFHYENAKLMLEMGKNVLCEKPFTVNSREMKELAGLAEAKGLFIMEAMWTRFLPATVQMRKWLEEGVIGEVKQVRADMGFMAPKDPEGRLFNPDLAGGALLDVGIYPLSFANMIFRDKPVKIKALGEKAGTGVDLQSVYIMEYAGGGVSILTSSIGCPLPNRAEVIGEKGIISLGEPFLGAKSVTLKLNGIKEEKLHFDFPEEEGFKYEITAATDSLLRGEKENGIMPVSHTVQLQESIDEIKAQLGLRYRNDNEIQ